MTFMTFTADAAATTTSAQELTGFAKFFYSYGSIILLVLMFVALYFLMIRPQRKRQKEEQAMRENVRVGDRITTIGGICGRVLNVKEEELVIETGADRSKMTIKKWAIQQNETVHDTPADSDDDDDDDI